MPVLLEDVQVHNLPYYTRRRVIPYLCSEAIEDYGRYRPLLALVAPALS